MTSTTTSRFVLKLLTVFCAALLSAAPAAAAAVAALDIDGDGLTGPSTDGTLVLRYEFGFRGNALIAGAIGTTATRTTPAAIEAYLGSIAGQLDIDGNGTRDPLTDGLLIYRYLSGYSGASLTTGLIGNNATRNTPGAVTAYLAGLAGLQVFASDVTFLPGTVYSAEPTPTSVTVAVAVAFQTGNKTLNLLLTDSSGAGTTVASTLVDNGDLTKGDDIANDGVYHNKFNVNPANTTDLYYVAVDPASGQRSVVSRLPVIAHLTPAAITTTTNFNTSIDTLVKQQLAAGKAWPDVRTEVMKTLQANTTEVKLSGLSDDGDGVWWVTKDELLVVVQSSSYAAPGQVFKGGGGQQAGRVDTIPASVRNQTILQPNLYPGLVPYGTHEFALDANTISTDSNRALVLSPYALSFEPDDEADDIAKMLGDKGFDVTLKQNAAVTVADFKNLGDYGVIVISSHGDNYYQGLLTLWSTTFGDSIPFWAENSSQVVILTGVKWTATNNTTFEADLKTQRLVLTASNTLAVMPSFIKTYAGNLPNSLVYVSSCRSSFNSTMADAFISRGAKTYLGYSDYVLANFSSAHGIKNFQELLDGKTTGELTGIGDVNNWLDTNAGVTRHARYDRFGSTNLVIIGGLKNGSFETGSVTGWNHEGDTRVITQLGPLTPQDGTFMSIISTGLGSVTESVSRIFQKFLVPPNATRLKLRYNVISEEPMEFVGSIFDDKFEVALTPAGASRLLLKSETINSSAWLPITGIDFAGGDSTVFQTGWKDLDVDMVAYRGKVVTLELKTYDSGDSIYDTAAVIDNARVETAPSLTTSLITGPAQVVTGSVAATTTVNGGAVSIDLNYTSANPLDATLPGLGIRLHFNSSKLTFAGFANVLTKGRVGEIGPFTDSGNLDQDTSTDSYVALTWADVTGNWPGNDTLRLASVNFTAANVAVGSSALNVTAIATASGYAFDGSPAQFFISNMTLNRTGLTFKATKAPTGGAIVSATPAQEMAVLFVGGPSAWTAAVDQPWLQITPGTGAGSKTITVALADPGNALAVGATLAAKITLTSPTALNSPVQIPVALAVTQSSQTTQPFGSFDTPTNNATGVTGAIPVTGWALDDIAVQKVQLWRDCVEAIDRPAGACAASVPGGPANFVYIGDAAFLAGARPDVETANTTLPQAYKAGWGYLMSTNALPHLLTGKGAGGQGTFTLSAYAVDIENQFFLLGTKTITIDNDHAIVPFGAIDTPSQGGLMTVGVYASFGWAMTQAGKCIDTTKTTSYKVYIDGVSLPLNPGTNWFPGLTRPDIAAAYPGLCNTNNALAAYYIDANALGLTNGLHTTGWDVVDDKGNVAGIGSRFFNVLIGSSVTNSDVVSGFSRTQTDAAEVRLKPDTTYGIASDRPLALGHAAGLSLIAPALQTIRVQIGGDESPFTALTPGTSGQYAVRFGAGGRMALDLGGPVDAGYQIVGDELRALPAGSTLDAAAGFFAWQPPVPFLGPFHLVFIGGHTRTDVVATVVDPTMSAAVTMHIDTPANESTVSGGFVIAGWALDPQAATGTGIDTLHVWAYRRDGVAPPQFLGAAAIGGLRPDVAAVHGDQFEHAGFTLSVPALPPGVYDVITYPWSHRTGGFETGEVRRVVVP